MISLVKHDNAFILRDGDKDVLVLAESDLAQLRNAVMDACGLESAAAYRQRVVSAMTVKGQGS